MRGLIKQSNVAMLVALCIVPSNSFADRYVLDFSESDSADIVFNSAMETRDLGIEFSHALPVGTYEIVLDRNNRFIVPVERGLLRVENENKQEVSRIELLLPILTLEEGDKLVEAFHQSLGLSLEKFNQWSQPIREYKYPRDFYTSGMGDNYPEISMSVRTSFNKDVPYLIGITFGWNNWFHQSRGTSTETNSLQNLTFDVPEILKSMKVNMSEPAIAETSEPIAEPELTYEKKRPVEVIFDEAENTETLKEPAEQSSNWWLWLIGAVVVGGGIGLALRRKS